MFLIKVNPKSNYINFDHIISMSPQNCKSTILHNRLKIFANRIFTL